MSNIIYITEIEHDDAEQVIVEWEDSVIADVVTNYDNPEDNIVSRLGLAHAFEEVANYNADFVIRRTMTAEEYEKRYYD